MYDKQRIDRLTNEYIRTRDGMLVEQVIEALDPMIDIILHRRYRGYEWFFGDLKQDLNLRILNALRNPRFSCGCVKLPSTFWYSRIRRYSGAAWETYRRWLGEGEWCRDNERRDY